MNTYANPANFNGGRPVIDPTDAAMLLIDHQSGLFQTVQDMPMPTLRAQYRLDPDFRQDDATTKPR